MHTSHGHSLPSWITKGISKDKTPVFVTRLGKRSAQWFIAPVPEPKKYIYIPSNKFINMVKIIIQKRINKKSSIFISCNGE